MPYIQSARRLVIVSILVSTAFSQGCKKAASLNDSAETQKNEAPLFLAQSKIRGLESINIDRWTSNLLNSPPRKLPANVPAQVLAFYNQSLARPESEWLSAFFTPLTQTLAASSYATAEEYSSLAQGLYSARDRIRITQPIDRARIALQLLSTLTDETLLAMSQKFPDAPTTWEWHGPASPTDCPAKYGEAPFCEGDLILSKSEAFSGLLFLFRSPYSSNFSHVAMGVVNSANEARLLEADIQGREVLSTHDLDGLPKVSIYRQKKGIKPSASVLAKLIHGHSFGFNYKLKPDCGPDYFCSELAYCTYKSAGATDEENPYPEKLWSTPGSPEEKEIHEFVTEIGGMDWGRIPAPGDLELNRNFQPVVHIIHLRSLREVRAQTMIVNAFIQLLHERPGLMEGYLKTLDHFSQSNGNAGTLPRFVAGQFAQSKHVLNEGVTPRGLAFYMHFQLVLLPEVMAKIRKASQGRLPLPSELRDRAYWEVEKRLMTSGK